MGRPPSLRFQEDLKEALDFKLGYGKECANSSTELILWSDARTHTGGVDEFGNIMRMQIAHDGAWWL